MECLWFYDRIRYIVYRVFDRDNYIRFNLGCNDTRFYQSKSSLAFCDARAEEARRKGAQAYAQRVELGSLHAFGMRPTTSDL